MDSDLSRLLRNKVSFLLGNDTKIYVRNKTILIDCPRSFPNRISIQSKITQNFDQEKQLRSYKIIFVDPDSIITNELRRFRILAKEII
jgi:hypothetical protein